MKLWRKRSNNILAITIWPTTISVHHFKKTSPRITLENIWSYNSPDFFLDNLQLHTITPFAKILQIHAQSLGGRIVIGLRGQPLQENIVKRKTKTVSPDNFDFPSSHTHTSGFQYLYSCNDTEHMFYAWHIPHHILFLYQLAVHISKQRLLDIIPYQSALFTAYVRYKHPAFRQLEFARDMNNHHHSIEHYFSQESIYRLIKIHPKIAVHDHPQLMHAAGLAFSVLERQ